MGKIKKQKLVLFEEWIQDLKVNCFAYINPMSVQCLVCSKTITAERKSQLAQHLETGMHKDNLKRQNEDSEASTSTALSSRKNAFFMDLCEAMIAVNVPWRSLDKPKWRDFLQKYTARTIPDEPTLRKSYLSDYHADVINKIRDDIGDNYIWVSVDETTDAVGRYMANMIVGKMSENQSRPYLLACRPLTATNYETIVRFVNSSLSTVFPNGAEEKVLLSVTDAAKYMLKAGSTLKILFPNMLHVTCTAHGLHRVAELIRDHFEEVNKLISAVKKIFKKAPSRIQKYREHLGDLQLPPEPILTRWGTWLSAACFYSDHFEEIKPVVDSFDKGDAACIGTAQELVANDKIQADLSYIWTHFHDLPSTITKLETMGMPLTQSALLLGDSVEKLKKVPGPIGDIIATKVDYVLNNNPDLSVLLDISNVLSGASSTIPETVKREFISKFKYAPITSCDVDRSFSAYKLILTDKRHSFTVENMEKTIVAYCYLNYGT